MLGNLEKAGLTAEDATRAMVTSALLHPDAMFRTTPLAGDAARARRLAEHLSYALWDAPPDAELAAVGDGTAGDLGARLRGQAERLGSDARAVPVLARFMAQWLHVDLDLKLAADAALRDVAAVSRAARVRSGRAGERRSGDVVRQRHARLRAQEQPRAVRPDVGAGDGGRGVRDLARDLAASRGHRRGGDRAIRRGTRMSGGARSSAAVLVRSSLLCQSIPPPSAELVALAGEVTDRTKDARCMGCHQLLEPVGAAFAALDRDFTGTAPAASSTATPSSPAATRSCRRCSTPSRGASAFADCFARQMWAFFLEQPPAEVDAASIAELAAVVRSGGSLGDVVSQMAVSLEARSRAAVPWCEGP